MVTGNTRTSTVTSSYRELKKLNQSMLKIFDENPQVFYKQFVLGEQRKEEDTASTLLGSLCDYFLLECRGDENEFNQNFDKYFCLFQGNRTTAQVFDLCDELFTITKNSMTEGGEITVSFEDRFKEAFNNIQSQGKYKGKTWEKGLEDFNKSGKEYFDTLLQSIGKKVVDLSLVEKAKFITNQLLTDDFTKNLWVYEENTEFLTKFAIEFEWYGFECKMEADAILVDHRSKTIYPFDLKVLYDNEEFGYSYLKNGYYLQQAFYWQGIKEWANAINIDEYEVKPMTFIVADSSKNGRRPLIYKLTEHHLMQGLTGFYNNGRYYRGVSELMGAVSWANYNQIWNVSREAFENNGIITLQEFK